MQTIQGFVTIQQFINNTPGVVSPLGELTLQARTYSREPGQYRSENSPGYLLHTFNVRDSVSGQFTVANTDIVETILNVSRELVAYAGAHSLPYNKEDMRLHVTTTNMFRVADLEFGQMVFGNNIELPEYVTFSVLDPSNNSNILGYVKVWFADESFRNQYTDYSVTVVPPIDNLDNFFLNYAEVLEILKEVNIRTMGQRVTTARQNDPDSMIRFEEFYFHNRYNSSAKQLTPWGYLLYGLEGDYIDIILDETVEYLKNNSSHSEAEWETVFPELFKRTEFLIVPRYDRIATRNLEDSSSLYSQVTGLEDLTLFTKKFLSFYGEDFVAKNSYTLTFPWRTLQATITNGLKNAEGKTDFLKMFPDYIPVPIVNNGDFGRMTLETQEWSRFIQEVLIHAEALTPGSFLPSGFRRVVRDGKIFVAASHKNVNYLVAAKMNEEYQ